MGRSYSSPVAAPFIVRDSFGLRSASVQETRVASVVLSTTKIKRPACAAVLAISIGIAGGARAASDGGSGDGDRPYWRTNLFKRVATDQKFLVTRWWPQEIKD